MAIITDVRFEHYLPSNTLGVHEPKPRISWTYASAAPFHQQSYTLEVTEHTPSGSPRLLSSTAVPSSKSTLVPWPLETGLASRQRISARVKATSSNGETTDWSAPAFLETGLLSADDWSPTKRISSPWPRDSSKPQPEELYRKTFALAGGEVASARLYVTAQGVYEAGINGRRVGDYFLAPGWTEYAGRLQYQTYDVSSLLARGEENCVGVRVAEGWFSGRLGFEGGKRGIWGDRNSVLALLEVTFKDGAKSVVATDDTWSVRTGPIKQAELYDGERYDAREEVAGWSSPKAASDAQSWVGVEVLDALPPETRLVAGYGEPVRRIETVRAIEKITTPSGKTILDFGQNLVGYLRLKDLKAPRGHTVTLRHAEVLENGELGLRPLRICEARDEYTAKGDDSGESWEPRFTFHGFRYAQIDNWPESGNVMDSIEAVVCHTDMQKIGHFHCSNDMVNKLYQNVCWSMRGNFLSIPTDCPQRDERLGWTGDLALFAPTAAFLYQCSGILKNWLVDFEIAQQRLGGLPATVVPDVLSDHRLWGLTLPLAIWHDVAVLGPWAVYSATGDVQVLRTQYKSMQQWVSKMDRHVESSTPNLWHPKHFQLGDWLDPAAPPESPWKSATDSKLAADAFLIQTLRLMASIARLVGQPDDASAYEDDFSAARRQFQDEYVSPNGRLSSDSQTAYALAITFDLLSPSQRAGAGARLARIVRTNAFKIGTGFAGTPYVCEALAQTGHGQVAYAMLLNAACPSWLYPISMGATTTWERWDSMLPDGTVNPGEMTSFNHYAFGAVVTFLHERVAGLRREGAGWESIRVEPLVGGGFTSAEAEHVTPYGKAAVSWRVEGGGDFRIEVEVPQGTSAEIVIPDGKGEKREKVGAGKWVFETRYEKKDDWPVKPINPLPAGL